MNSLADYGLQVLLRSTWRPNTTIVQDKKKSRADFDVEPSWALYTVHNIDLYKIYNEVLKKQKSFSHILASTLSPFHPVLVVLSSQSPAYAVAMPFCKEYVSWLPVSSASHQMFLIYTHSLLLLD